MKNTLTLAACISSSTCGRVERSSFGVKRFAEVSRIRWASSQTIASRICGSAPAKPLK